jgi:DNA primase
MDRRFGRQQANIYTAEQVKRILNGSGISIESEVDSDFIVFCPFHNNYRTPAGEVSKERGTFFCFSCQTSKSLVEFVMFVTQKSYFESLRFIESSSTESDIVDVIDKALVKEPEWKPFDEILIRRLHAQALDSPRAMRYYEGRRISENSVNKFLLGYSDNQDMVIIPMHNTDGSVLVGFVARSVEGKDFKNTPNLPKSRILFNLHRVKKYDTVYVVESSFDAIRLDQNGIPAVATLGANVSKNQTELLTKHFNNVIVVGDNDDAGKGMQDKILDRLGSRATLITIPSRFKDIGDMTDEDIQKLNTKISDPLFSLL